MIVPPELGTLVWRAKDDLPRALTLGIVVGIGQAKRPPHGRETVTYVRVLWAARLHRQHYTEEFWRKRFAVRSPFGPEPDDFAVYQYGIVP